MADYMLETREAVETRASLIRERARDVRAEADLARQTLGLDGPARVALEEAVRLEAAGADWGEVGERVAAGYPYCEREGFEAAVDACGEAWRWQPTSETLVEATYAHNAELRFPVPAMSAYRSAFASRFFDGFEVCSTFETESGEVARTTNYLFGKWRFAALGECLFLVEQWSG